MHQPALMSLSLSCALLAPARVLLAQPAPQPLFTIATNEVRNADFEEVEGPKILQWTLPDNAAIETKITHSGKTALFLSGKAAQQEIMSVIPGETIRLGGWMRGENVQGEAFIKVAGREETSAATKALSGDFDWVWQEVIFTVPASHGQMTLSLNPGSGGKVWFDGLTMQRQLPPMQLFPQWPNYRGLLPKGDRHPLRAAIELADSPDLPTGLTLRTLLQNRAGKVILQKAVVLKNHPASQTVQLAVQRPLEHGVYQWKFSLQTADGRVLQEISTPIETVEKMPAVYIDGKGRTIRNGKAFFPFGIFLGEQNDHTEEHMVRIKAAGFNTLIDYRHGHFTPSPETYMNNAQKHGMAVIYSVKDLYRGHYGFADPELNPDPIAVELIEKFRNHPATLAWYINDEFAPESMADLKAMYKRVRNLDPNHPAYSVLYQVDQIQKYFDSTDIIGSDPYPFGWAPWSMVADWTQKAKAATRNSLGMWQVTQIHNGSVYNIAQKADTPIYRPSYEGMRNMAFQAIAGGANGLIFYSYFDLWYADGNRQKDQASFDARWPEVAKLGQEIRALIPVFENGKDVPLTVQSGDVAVRGLEYGGELYLFTANPETSDKSLSVVLPGRWEVSSAKDGVTVGVNGDTKWEFALPGRGVGVIRLKPGRN